MRRSIAAATVAASLAVGGLAGATLGGPSLAGAVGGTATGAVGWVEDALSGLVDDGTITQEQADAVETALEDARPEGRFGHRFGFGLGSSVVADTLDMTVEELRAALEDGTTIADLAEDRGVEVGTIVEAVVTELEERLAAHVADGDLTQEEADEMLANARERITAHLNGELPAFDGEGRGFGMERHGRRGPGHRFGLDDDAEADDDATGTSA
jgi:hypothetical protein